MNELKWTHLNNANDFIITWLYNDKWKFYKENAKLLLEADFIDYSFSNEFEHWLWKWINRDYNSVVISKVNNKPKYSSDYFNCTGFIVIWTDKDWCNISILSHQDPWFFLSSEPAENIKDFWYWDNITKKEMSEFLLKEQLNELKNKSIDWTIDIIILLWSSNKNYSQYKKSIIYLEQISKEVFNINPVIVWWPTNNTLEWFFLYKDIIVDTKNRKVFFLKWSSYNDNINFVSNEVEEIFQNPYKKLIKEIIDKIRNFSIKK